MDDQTMTPQTAGTGRMRKYGPGVALVAAGLIGGAVLAGTAAASATETSPTPSQSANGYSMTPPQGDQDGSDANGQKGSRPQETPLTGDTADKVKAAVLAKYPNATIDRLETDSEGVYEAHITKADGTQVVVAVDADFTVTGEQAFSGRGPGGPGGKGGPGAGETELTGDVAAKVKAAVLAKYPNATIDRLETDADGVYEAHITKADGTRVTVEVDKSYAVTGEEAHPAGGRGHGDGDGPDGTAPSGEPSASTSA
jgi:uncharacterized membrane protein YkoI